MLKKYFYFLTLILSMVLFTACSDDDSSTGSGSGSGGGSTQTCTLTDEDIIGTWQLSSASSSASLTTTTNVSVLDGWSAVTTPMELLIVMADNDSITASFDYLHVASNEEEISFLLSDESYWGSAENINMYIEIKCEATDFDACSSFLSYSDDDMNNIYTALNSLTAVTWATQSDGSYQLTIPTFSEVLETTTLSTSESTISIGNLIIEASTPLVIETVTDIQDVWNQSYMTFNSDGTVVHFNTLDCSLITPENEFDCYNEGCTPIDLDGTISGCENIDCSALTTTTDCLAWNACVWVDVDDACIGYASNDVLASGWVRDCNDLILTTTESDEVSYNVVYDLSITDDQMSISLSQDFCSVYYYYGYECDAYSGPAEDFYGLSGEQIDGLNITTSLHYSSATLPSIRLNEAIVVDNPIIRPSILQIFRK